MPVSVDSLLRCFSAAVLYHTMTDHNPEDRKGRFNGGSQNVQ